MATATKTGGVCREVKTMPVITRRQLSSFCGALEAGEFLYKSRRDAIVFDTADRYLPFAESVTRGQFLSVARSLGSDRLDIFRDRIDSQSYKLLEKYISTLSAEALSEFQEQVHIDTILNVYDSVVHFYIKSEVYVPQPGDMLKRLIAKSFTRLRESHRRKAIGAMATAIYFINTLQHSEGQLVMWLDEDCDKRFAAYILTLVSASVYQPESLAYICRDVRKALRRKALFHRASGVFDPYDRQQFLSNFVGRLDLLDEFTSREALEEIDSLTLIKELRDRSVPNQKEWQDRRIIRWRM